MNSIWQDITWQCLHFMKREEIEKETHANDGIKFFWITFPSFEKNAMLKSLGKTFEFPGAFGENWDALEDMLQDLSWLNARGYVLIVENAPALWREQIANAGVLVDIWLAAAEWWSKKGVGFHLVFVIDE